MIAMRRTAVLLLLPLVFFGTGAIVAGLSIRAAKLVAPEPVTLLDAAVLGRDDVIFRMVTAGEDPGHPVVLERSSIHGSKGDTTSPLLVAIATGDLSRITYMLKQTQRMADPPNDLALCIAAKYGHSNVARHLIEIGAPVPKDGCGDGKMPEDIAVERGAKSLAARLRRYRIEGK